MSAQTQLDLVVPDDISTSPILLPGSHLVGCGYDVLNGHYANSSSCGFNLFEFPEATESEQFGHRTFYRPKVITCNTNIGSSLSASSGSTLQEYIKKLNSTTKIEGEYSFFSASVEAEFGNSTATNDFHAFSKVSSYVTYFTLELPPHHASMLKPSVKDDIDTMSDLNKLFDTYNTHYLASFVMGGVANYTSTTSKFGFKSSFSLDVVAKMSFKAMIGSISGEERFKYNEDINSFNKSSDTSLKTIGGDPALADDKFVEHVGEWNASVIDYMALVNFKDEHSLVGIWELASTEKRRQEIHGFYPSYCRLHNKSFSHFHFGTGPGPVIHEG